MHFPVRPSFRHALALSGLVLTGAGALRAEDYTYTASTAGSIRQGFARAAASPQNRYTLVVYQNTYKFKEPLEFPAGNLTVVSTDPDHPEDLILQGDSTFRLIKVGGTGLTVPYLKLHGMTLQMGHAGDGKGGGAIYSKQANLDLQSCRILGNSAAPGSDGNGIHFEKGILNMKWCRVGKNGGQGPTDLEKAKGQGGGLFLGHLTTASILSSTFDANSAAYGGGLFAGAGLFESPPSVTLALINCTVSGNSAAAAGGGVYAMSNRAISLQFNTIVRNTAALDETIPYNKEGGGLFVRGQKGDFVLVGNVIALNKTLPPEHPDPGRGDPNHDCSAWFEEGATIRYKDNAIGKLGACGDLGSVSMSRIGDDDAPYDPRLGDLADNGARLFNVLKTHRPNSTSSLINGYHKSAGNGNTTMYGCQVLDSRRYYRQGEPETCDIGAVERGEATVP